MAYKITVADTSILRPGISDFAVEFRIKPTSIGWSGTPVPIIAKYDATSGEEAGWYVGFAKDGSNHQHLYLILANAGTIKTATGTSAQLAAGTEVYVAVNFDRSGNAVGYIDGAAVTACTVDISALVASSIVNTTGLTVIDDDSGFIGDIREIRYYTRVLTTDEITWNYNNPESIYDKTDLKIWLKCDEGTGLYCKDSSGNGNNGTITSATWVTAKYVGCLICVDRNKAVWVKEGESTYMAGPMAVFDGELVLGCGESGGTKPNLVYLDEDTNTDQATDGATATFPSEYQSPQFDSGMPDIQKKSRFVMVEYRDRLAYTGGTFNIWYRLDEGSWTKLNKDAAITLGTSDKSITINFPIQSDAYYRIDFAIDAEYDLEVSRIMAYPELLTKAGTK